ncbi:MAG: hypothetical protein EBW44_06420 [Rhodobacteraceae bacterium]|nr:hypothetical protein [Paracoccaceae bacterium]
MRHAKGARIFITCPQRCCGLIRNRFGSGRFIALAIFLLVIVKLVESVVTEPARTNLDFWYLVYAPSVVGLIMFWVLMYLSINPNVLRKQSKLAGQNT